MSRRGLHAVVVLSAVFIAGPALGVSTTEVLVKFKPGVSTDAVLGLEQAAGVTQWTVSPWTGVYAMTVPGGSDASSLVNRFSASPAVDYAEPNGTFTAAFLPNDPYYSPYQWNLSQIGMPQAWDITHGHPSTIVAVIDTGVAYENYGVYGKAPDLAGTAFVTGYDFVNGDSHPNDDDGHGTHVTGTIAQTTNNSYGVAGIAYGVSIMPLKALDSTGSGTYEDIADAVTYAADHGASVINLSLGGPSDSQTLHNAIIYAHNKGVTIVCATGNDNELGGTAISFPARYPETLAVGATRYDRDVTWYSNKGPQIDLVAPGGDMNVDQNGDGYGDGILQNDFNLQTGNTKDFAFWFLQGTSMATPHVAAVAALLHDLGVKDPEQIRTILRLTATDLSAPGFDNASGYGLLNATKALRLAQRWPVPGDANTDGKVDGADLAIWQERYDPLGLRDNNTFAMGDFNGDGKVDGGDLALWQQNYAPLGINVSALTGDDPIPLFGDGGRALPAPEPATLGLMSISLIMGAAARRMKAKRRAGRGRPPDRRPPDAPPPTVSPRRTC